MTRRAFLASLVPSRWGSPTTPSTAPAPAARTSQPPRVAVIAGRHCLAYQGSFCSTCRERCPIPGAILIERGLPRVNTALCDGCGLCHDLCPAPVNAILMRVAQASSLPSSPLQAGSLRYTDHARLSAQTSAAAAGDARRADHRCALPRPRRLHPCACRPS